MKHGIKNHIRQYSKTGTILTIVDSTMGRINYELILPMVDSTIGCKVKEGQKVREGQKVKVSQNQTRARLRPHAGGSRPVPGFYTRGASWVMSCKLGAAMASWAQQLTA